MLTKEQIEKLMWEYCHEIDSDNIIGLHVCDNFLKWMTEKLMEVYYK